MFLRASLPALVLTAALAAGCGGPQQPARWLEPPTHTFQAAVVVEPDTSGRLQPQVQATVPHHALIFHRHQDGPADYTSRLEVAVTAWRGGHQVGGGVTTGQAWSAVPAPEAAAGALTVAVPLQIRGLEPVELLVQARVLGTLRSWKRTLNLEPQTLAAAPLLMGDLTLDLPDGPELDADLVMLPLNAAVIRLPGAAPWPADGVRLELGGRAADGAVLPRRRHPIAVSPDTGDTMHVRVDWPVAELPFGRSVLDAALTWRAGPDELSLPWDRPLEFVNLSVPVRQDEVWNDHLTWLDGKRPAARLDSLRGVPAVARVEAWRDLWRDEGDVARLDHLRRIVEADRRFGGRKRGASSDRGLVWIRWGEPDAMEQRLDQRNLGGVWEIWSYESLNRRYYFHDPHGLGDFQLRRTDTAS